MTPEDKERGFRAYQVIDWVGNEPDPVTIIKTLAACVDAFSIRSGISTARICKMLAECAESATEFRKNFDHKAHKKAMKLLDS